MFWQGLLLLTRQVGDQQLKASDWIGDNVALSLQAGQVDSDVGYRYVGHCDATSCISFGAIHLAYLDNAEHLLSFTIRTIAQQFSFADQVCTT